MSAGILDRVGSADLVVTDPNRSASSEGAPGSAAVQSAHVELRDVAPGLWIWRLQHPDWKPGVGWEPVVASTCVESGGEILVLDPLAPPSDTDPVWQRLDAHASWRRDGASRRRARRQEACTISSLIRSVAPVTSNVVAVSPASASP